MDQGVVCAVCGIETPHDRKIPNIHCIDNRNKGVRMIAESEEDNGYNYVTRSAVSGVLESVVDSQLSSLNDTDGFATAWQHLLREAKLEGSSKNDKHV